MADSNYFSSLPSFEGEDKDKGKKRKRNLRTSDIDSPPAPSGVHKRKNAPKKPKETPVKKAAAPSTTSEVLPSPSKKLRYAPDETRWLSANPSKRWGELFFLYYSIVWISFFAVIVIFKIYELCGNYGYTAIGLTVSIPCFLYPLLFPGEFDRKIPLTQRYWFKANIWIAVISFIGNYFWTHYFYVVLKARYTFPTTWDLNRVPFYLYLITHAYFNTYHTFSNVLIRRFRTGRFYRSVNYDWMKAILNIILIGGFSITIAFMEAFSISSVPYYSYPDRYLMYTVGSMFYGIYFYVSFPMFFRLDEYIAYTDNNSNTRKNNTTTSTTKVTYNGWTVSQTFIDALAACMLVTVILDLWRLALGPIIGDSGNVGVPFVY